MADSKINISKGSGDLELVSFFFCNKKGDGRGWGLLSLAGVMDDKVSDTPSDYGSQTSHPSPAPTPAHPKDFRPHQNEHISSGDDPKISFMIFQKLDSYFLYYGI